MLTATNITKNYGSLQVLKGVSLQVSAGSVVSIVGPSGAGKSTLLQILSSLDQPNSGQVVLNGQNMLALKDKEMALFRNQNVGFVFQFHNLLAEFTAIENVALPALIGGIKEKEAKQKAADLLHQLGLSHRQKHYPNQLSGGEQQRVAVARALINNPAIVFADEPTGNLDTANAEALHKLFFELREQFNLTFIIVTHNRHLAQMADRTLTMADGLFVDTDA